MIINQCNNGVSGVLHSQPTIDNNRNNHNNHLYNNKSNDITANIFCKSSSSSLNINHNNNLNRSNSRSVTVTADAATVAIAKDMLQLHHTSTLSNNNNNNSNNNVSNNNNDELNSSSNNNNNNNNGIGILINQQNTVSNTTPTPEITTVATTTSVAAATPTTILINATPAQQEPQQQLNPPQPPPENAVGYLKYNDELLYITEQCTIIGRNSSTSHVHFHVAENNLVSRKHFQILYDPELRDFFVQCLSKNGIFVDDFLQRRNADPLKLPANCFFRFPSTEMRIHFESFLHTNSSRDPNHSDNTMLNRVIRSGNVGNTSGNMQHVIISTNSNEEHQMRTGQHPQTQGHQQQSSVSSKTLTIDNSNIIYSPLKISIPKKEQKSPYLSPTGTISAANSCPASPRQGFHQNQNNYNNNNLQNQQDLFQTPSTASYNHNEKPPYSYAQLIVQAISAAPDKQLTLSGIYSFIVKHYPYYRKETNKGWQNSIRHNLSLNRYFIKVARSQDEPGKGSFWRIDPDSGAKLIDHSYKKRRQRSSQGFRPSYGMPRSAPVSPSHMEYSADNSRESSPLQDIILQSAPGSPGITLEHRNNDSAEVIYQQQTANSNNNHQHSNNTYFVSRQQSENNGNGSNTSVGALIALKRNHAMSNSNNGQQQQQQHQHQQQFQGLHPDIIYEEIPADYSGNMDESDECDVPKRPKLVTEML